MTTKYLRKEVARKCAIHSAVIEKCAERLTSNAVFEKKEVINSLSFQAIESAIRWDYIAQFISEEQGIELIPMAQRFFNRHKASEREVAPEKFIAMGHGKKTVGYASVFLNDGVFALKKLENRKAMANGAGKAFIDYNNKLATRNLLPKDNVLSIENKEVA